MKSSLFPTLKNYKKEYLGKDIAAGIMIAAVSIPISMGYAEVSGLPAVFGLYGSVLPILFFALFYKSFDKLRHFKKILKFKDLINFF